MTIRGVLLGVLCAGLLPVLSCGEDEAFVRRFADFSFETSISPWEPDGTDLENPPVSWSIERTNERANEGEWSLRFHLENLNDAGKIWIEAAPIFFQRLDRASPTTSGSPSTSGPPTRRSTRGGSSRAPFPAIP